MASGAANGTAANGAGITVDGASATLTYQSTGDNWAFNKNLDVTGNIVVSGTVDGVDIAARDAVLTSTTTTAGAALPKAGGTMTGTLLVTAGNGDQLQLNNAGERFTQISLQHSGTQNGALWLDDTDSMVDLYANTSHGIRLKTGGDNPRVTILLRQATLVSEQILHRVNLQSVMVEQKVLKSFQVQPQVKIPFNITIEVDQHI